MTEPNVPAAGTHVLPHNLFSQPPRRVHLMGICGVGTAGLAWLLYLRGWKVSGCDRNVPPILAAFFRRHGITVLQNHGTDHVADCDVLVYSAAIHRDEPELVMARSRGIPVLSRGECLAGFVNSVRSVAVCGTHGKTTTSCFTTRLLQLIGKHPFWCIGGFTSSLNTTVGPTILRPGAISPENFAEKIAVVEADESDGTLAYERPAVTVVTNIEMDHLDHFADEAALEACFAEAVTNTREGIAVCADHPWAARIGTLYKGRVLTYGFAEDAVVRATVLKRTADSTRFDLWYGNQRVRTVTLGVPGDHNVQNALGALTAGILLGFTAHTLADVLEEACGELPSRRFQWLTPKNASVRVVTDYAHHPTEIRALMSIATRIGAKRLRVVFQPHRYSRTKALLGDFPAAFGGADELILMPVYEASERFISGGGSYDLYAAVRKETPDRRVLLARNSDECLWYLRRTAREGDLILIVGAGDIVKLGPRLCDGTPLPQTENPVCARLRATLSGVLTPIPDAPLSRFSFYRVGGTAECYAEISDLPTLSAVALFCHVEKLPLTILGGGSNFWFSDFGQPGLLCRLKGPTFESFTRDGRTVTVGAGMTGSELLARLEREGLSGLEFMQGVPGTVGGWISMNAGAHGKAVWEVTENIRGITADGQFRHISRHDVTAGYRAVHGLRGISIVSATFRLTPAPPETVRANRSEAAATRVNLAGLKTCGSLFRNPNESLRVGAVLDRLGLKGERVGGACVSDRHANVVVAEDTCTASDILALSERLKTAFRQETGIELHTEVCGIEDR